MREVDTLKVAVVDMDVVAVSWQTIFYSGAWKADLKGGDDVPSRVASIIVSENDNPLAQVKRGMIVQPKNLISRH